MPNMFEMLFSFIGIWFFHCHVESHVEQGQAMLFKVGNPKDWETPPNNFPRCGSYGTEDSPQFCPKSSCKQDTNGNITKSQDSNCLSNNASHNKMSRQLFWVWVTWLVCHVFSESVL